ncbi:MAG: hypothetical protein HYZ28_25930 [Myxococcales bacterium]|nr:hypothetical protein [Myxococcales bacterium]
MHRPLGKLERNIWCLDQASSFNFVVAVHLRGRVEEEWLRGAVAAMRRRHALLGARIELSPEGWPHFTLQGTPPTPVRVLRRAHPDDWRREATEEVGRPFGWREGPLWRASSLASTEASDVVLTFHHAIGDGFSAVRAVSDLVDDLSVLASGKAPVVSPVARVRALEALFPPEARGLRGFFRGAGALLRQVASFAIRRPRKLDADEEAALGVRRPRFRSGELSAAETAALRSRCREEQTTVQGALTAAMLTATQAVTGEARLSCLAPVNLRPFLEGEARDAVGYFVGSAVTYHRIRPQGSFWALAREVRAALRPQVEGAAACAVARLLGQLSPRRLSPETAAAALSHPMWGSVAVTNVGALSLAPRQGPFALEGFSFAAGTGAYGPAPFLVAKTFRGRMSLTLLYAEPLIRAERAERLHEEALARLRTAATGR